MTFETASGAGWRCAGFPCRSVVRSLRVQETEVSIRVAVGNALLTGLTPLLSRSRAPLSRLLGYAVVVKRRHGQGADRLKERIAAAFHELAEADPAGALAFERHRHALSSGHGYKCTLHGKLWGRTAGDWVFRLATRLANRRGITFDILRLDGGAAIPPHAHCGVVSGMLVIEGDVGFRTYDTEDVMSAAPLVKVHPRQAERVGPGGVSTSSMAHENLHWIHAYTPEVFIFRFTVTDVDHGLGEGTGRATARVYLLPDGRPDPCGDVLARRVDEATATRQPFSLLA